MSFQGDRTVLAHRGANAHVTEKVYDITYNTYQTPVTSAPTEAQLHYTVSRGNYNLWNPEINNYKFLGWYDEDGVEYKTIPVGTTGNIVLNTYYTSLRNLAVSREDNNPLILEDHNQNVNYVISDVEHQVIGNKYIQNFIVNRLQQEEATREAVADAYKYEDLEHGLIDAGANVAEDASSSDDTNDANAVTKGVHIDLNHAALNSTNRLTVDNYEKSDAELKVVQAKAVVGEIAVSVNDVEFNNKLNINVDNESLFKGKNINIRSKDDTNIEMYTTDAGLVGGDISVLLGYGEHHGDRLA